MHQRFPTWRFITMDAFSLTSWSGAQATTDTRAYRTYFILTPKLSKKLFFIEIQGLGAFTATSFGNKLGFKYWFLSRHESMDF